MNNSVKMLSSPIKELSGRIGKIVQFSLREKVKRANSHIKIQTYIYIQHYKESMKANESTQELVTSLREFLVCQADDCTQSSSISHKSSYRNYHFSQDGNRKTTHSSVPFDESVQFINFEILNQIYRGVYNRVQEGLRGWPTDVNVVAQAALYNSSTFKQLLMGSQTALNEYFYLLNIQRGTANQVHPNLSADFCTALMLLDDKKVKNLYKELCSPSPEWEYLNLEFNYASGINSNNLEAFIQQEQAYFMYYCNRVSEQKKQFNIMHYIAERNTNKDYVNDVYYYSPEFETFLEHKYETNPGEEQLFELREYYLHFWQYFFVVAGSSKNVGKYLQEEVDFYKEYEKFMEEQKLKQSFLSFRMWRINRKTSSYFPSLKNPFFLETFIYSFIDCLITKQLHYPQTPRNYDPKTFIIYLQEYVHFLTEKKEEFSFSRYSEYLDFRKVGEKFEQMLKKSKEIVYDKKFFLEYAHQQFSEGNKLAVKKYRKYQEKRRVQEDERVRLFREESASVREEVMRQEQSHFYEVVWNSFMNKLSEKGNSYSLSKESYKEFKAAMLESVDEEYVQQKEAEYRHSLEEWEQEEEGNKKGEEEINAQEEKMAGLIHEEERSDMSSSEEEREREQECPCCKGHPYECTEPECKVLGICSACMLD